MRLLVLAAAMSGCGNFSRLPGQDEVEKIVWQGIYGMTDEPPGIEWVAVDQLPGSAQGTTIEGWGIRIACGSDCGLDVRCTQPETFTHELMHWRAWLKLGDVDGLHFREDWSLPVTAQLAIIPSKGMCVTP